MSDWIKHDGSGCPFPKGTVLDVLQRGGFLWEGLAIRATVELWDWSEPIREYHVVAYRLHDNQAEKDRISARQAMFQDMLDAVSPKAPEGPRRVKSPQKETAR